MNSENSKRGRPATRKLPILEPICKIPDYTKMGRAMDGQFRNVSRIGSAMTSQAASAAAIDRAQRKAALRLLPFLFLLYIVAYLDRANVAFARLPMAAELHFSDG